VTTSPHPQPRRPWLAVIVASVAVFSMLSIFFASAQYLDALYRQGSGGNPQWLRALKFAVADWIPWVPLTPLILLLTWKVASLRLRWLVGLIVHPVVGLITVFLEQLAQAALIPLFIPTYFFRFSLDASTILTSLLVYVVIVGLGLGLDAHRRYRERELHASQLEAQLAQARLQALKSQLHPHFLFNTLHAISTLMHRDVDAAERMMSRLSDLLRLSLETFGEQTVSLRQELDFLRRYLEIEQIRFGDRLAVDLDIEPNTLDAAVPSFILQPLVENAVRHGISPRASGGTVRLRASRGNGQLSLVVEDDGVGLPRGNSTPREGVGLSNTRARLRQLYGEESSISLDDAAPGLCVRLALPYHEAAEEKATAPDA